jgi:uncharacterized membrane protein YhaH (DUF805 family)
MKRFFLRYLHPRRPGGYLFFVTWLLIMLVITPPSPVYRPVELLVIYSVTALTVHRLSDAGLSGFWAFVILPTIMAPWLCPLLIPGVRPNSVLAQLLDGLFYRRNWSQVALAVALLAVPLAIGLAPTRRPKAENGEGFNRATEAPPETP